MKYLLSRALGVFHKAKTLSHNLQQTYANRSRNTMHNDGNENFYKQEHELNY